jgi:DNA polymerase III epsilon subunit-like protein
MARLKLLPMDTETGGLTPDKTLLTLYMCVVNEHFQVVDELDLKLKPNDGKYNCDAQALKVNGINLEAHDKDPKTITYTEGAKLILSFLDKHHTGGRWPTLQPGGHNLPFDLGFVHHNLIPKEVWEKRCSYRILDTTPLCTFFKDIGKWPEKVGSLVSIVEFLGLKMRDAHNAKEDTLMWLDTYAEIVKREKMLLTAGGTTSTVADDLVLLEI